MKPYRSAILLLSLFLFYGCAGVQSEPAQSAKAEQEALPENACALFTARMCETLSAESEGCMMVGRVGQWLSPATCGAALQDIESIQSRVATFRKDCETVVERLCGKAEGQAGSEQICSEMRGELAGLSPEQCPKLLKEYDKVEAAFLEELKAKEPLDESERAALVEGDPPSFGPEQAGVVVAIFSDFQCPYCGMAAATVNQIRQNYGDRVHLVFRHFPLPFHQNAQSAAQAAQAAQEQGKFWEFHDELFAHQDALGDEDLSAYAKTAGLRLKAFESDREGDKAAAAVAKDLELGQRLSVRGTPTMFINGERVDNPLDYAAVAARIEALLSGAGAEAAKEDAATEQPAAAEPQE